MRDYRGRLRQFAGFTDRGATEELAGRSSAWPSCAHKEPAGELARFVEGMPPKLREKLAGWDILDSTRVAASRPLDDLPAEWRETLRAGAVTEKHVEHAVNRAGALFRSCGFTYWSKVPGNVLTRVKGSLKAKGLSIKTSNHVLASARSFCRWAVTRGYAVADPLRVLRPLNARVDRRQVRRALTEEELRKLIAGTQAGPTIGLVPGPTRALVYAMAAETGFRTQELAALRVANFADLDGPAPTVTLPAHASKHRREDVLPLRPSTARALSRFLSGRGALESAFGLPACAAPRPKGRRNPLFR